MNAVGIIPARAGSKRLPNKALLTLAGRPLIAHTCLAARASEVLTAVYVNTDSREIAAVAERFGIPCPVLRPARLAADDTPTRDSNLFLLDFLRQHGERYDAVVVLQPTSPLRTAQDIQAAWRLFQRHAPCEVVSVSPVAPHGWLGTCGADGEWQAWTGRELVYRLNGAIYIHGWDDYVRDRKPPRSIAYPMPSDRGVDIDTHQDLKYAEFLLSHEHGGIVGVSEERT